MGNADMEGARVPTTVRRHVGDEPAQGPLVLLVVGAGDAAQSAHALPAAGEITIGRTPGCDVVVDHPSISRRHVRLRLGAALTVEDLGSSNGTRLRGQRLAAHVPAPLAPGEVIDAGDVLLIVQRRVAAPRPRRLWPHGYFEARLEDECARAGRYGQPFGVLHVAWLDAAEAEVGLAAVFETLRDIDVAAAYDARGHELLLPDCGPAELEVAAARVATAARRLGLRPTIGMATYPASGRHPDALLAAALAEARPAALPVVSPGPAPAGGGAMGDLGRLVERVARGTISVLILGETGAGKEVLAERVHRLSPRAARPFLRLNCAALSESLLESELFGHERGAFTGAVAAKPGLLETADGGTVFLDEVGELPPGTQVKLLRVLEDRKVTRVGALRPRDIDVRFIAATNRDLAAEAAGGRFRQDLYYRLNGVTLHVPPLRERVEEIEGLARRFATAAAQACGLPEPGLSAAALTALAAYHWPGNVRELRNVIERAVLLADGGAIRPEHLPLEKMRAPLSTPPVAPLAAALAVPPAPDVTRLREDLFAAERRRIIDALEVTGGNQLEAAKRLGIARRTLLKRLDRYGIKRPRKK